MSDHSTLADEVAAELELCLAASAKRSVRRLENLGALAKKLNEIGMTRPIPLDPYDATHLKVVGVSTAGTLLPAFGGLLYGVSALAHGMKIVQKDILESWQLTRVRMGDTDHYGKDERLRWQMLRLIYNLLDEVIISGQARMILIDMPLFISRREEATIADDEMVLDEWNDLEKEVNAFWQKHLPHIYPFSSDGIVLASIRQHSATSLFSALQHNLQSSPDEAGPELGVLIRSEWSAIRQLGQSRLLERSLAPSTRTVAYSFEDLELDPRWQPQELNKTGILGFFVRVHHKTPLWHIQVPGHRTQWSSEMLDKLAGDISRSTLYDSADALPLPLWYARQYVRFPKDILVAYAQAIVEEMNRD